MRFFSTKGDHYAIGYYIGGLSKKAFSQEIMNGEAFHRILPWRESEWLHSVSYMAQKHFPFVWRELEGMADGAEQDIKDMLLWNTRGDIMPTGPEGCSSVAVKRDASVILTHNEDGDPALREEAFILDAQIENGARFVSFVYPGSIPGHTLGANSHGLAYTVNNIRLLDRDEGVPRMLTARALLEASSSKVFMNLLCDNPRAGGFHYMMADCKELQLYSVEVTHQSVDVEALSVGVHSNHLISNAFVDMDQFITDSSQARQERMEELSTKLDTQASEEDLLKILADHENIRLPIYRDAPDDPDMENTLATAVFNLSSKGVDISIRAAPEGPVIHRLSL